jgi:hypothetical protein
MLLGGEKLWMHRAGIGGTGCDGDRGIDIEGDGREANFVAAGLVAQFKGNVFCAERSVELRGERYAENDFVLVDVERGFGEGERAEFAFGVGDFAGGFKTSGEIGAEVGGNEVLGGRLAGVDVEAGADFEHDGELEGATARYGFERNVGGGGDDFAAGGNLRLRGGKSGDDDQQDGRDHDGCDRLHRCTCWPSC